MRNCSAYKCPYPVFGTDKLTGEGFCKTHQNLRTDLDKRTPFEKHMAKTKDSAKLRKSISEEGGLSYLIQDLDAIFSRYIRIKYANDDGLVKCFTCPKVLHWTMIQNGHYAGRGNKGVRFLETDCRPQCGNCNKHHNENKTRYTEALEKEQSGLAEWLDEQARQVYKPTPDELKGMILDYRMKLKLVESKLIK